MPVKQFELPKPNSLIMVMVVIKGPKGEIEANLVLDTGATHTFIRPGYFTAVGYDPLQSKKEHVQTGNGQADTWPVEVSGLEIMGLTLKRIKLYAQNFPSSLPIDGVLGLNVFRKLNRKLTIDFKVRMLELE